MSRFVSRMWGKIWQVYWYQSNLMLSPKKYPKKLKRWFRAATGEELELDNPVTFNQKIQWLKLYDSTYEKGRLADKYTVRAYVEDCIGKDYLVPLLGVWNAADEVDYDSLPSRFALKATHGCGWNYIVDNKEMLNREYANKQLQKWLNIDFSLYGGFELHYHWCKPRIIAESYLEGASSGSLVDYKVHVFNSGDPIILVCCDRIKGKLPRKAYYSSNWTKLPLREGDSDLFDVAKPRHLDKMLAFSKLLAADFAFVRVDWYEVEGKLYFGEMTFTPASGAKHFIPAEWNVLFGEKINLPNPIPFTDILRGK